MYADLMENIYDTKTGPESKSRSINLAPVRESGDSLQIDNIVRLNIVQLHRFIGGDILFTA
jgi:hypothetical protein